MLGLDEALVHAVLDDWRTAPVEPRLRAALAYLEKLTQDPNALSADDIEALHRAGVSNTAIREVAYVAFCFSVMDRLADAFDFSIPSEEQVKETAKFLNTRGYTVGKMIR